MRVASAGVPRKLFIRMCICPSTPVYSLFNKKNVMNPLCEFFETEKIACHHELNCKTVLTLPWRQRRPDFFPVKVILVTVHPPAIWCCGNIASPRYPIYIFFFRFLTWGGAVANHDVDPPHFSPEPGGGVTTCTGVTTWGGY